MDAIIRVIKTLQPRRQEASASAASVDDVGCGMDRRDQHASELSSLPYRPPPGSGPLDPFIEHDEMQRQKRMIDMCEKTFLKQVETPSTVECCDSCSQINFEAIYNDRGTILGASTAISLRDIGVVDKTWLNRSCSLCKFFAAIWESNKSYFRGANLCLVVLSSRNISKYAESIQVPKAVLFHNVLLLSHPQPRRVFDVDRVTLDNFDIVGPLFVSRRKFGTKNCVSVRPVEPDKIDFSVIRGWLQLCDSHHGDSCSRSKAPEIAGLQLLNCEARKLEPYIPGTKFVALSYVWGTNVNEQMRQSNKLGYSNLPRTIEDALNVTMKIGFQYLWVDRYCIPQFDDQVKRMQIANMDLIYNCATLIIVAACGEDSEFGLPGVSSRCRIAQPSIAVDEYDVVSALSSPVRDVRNSKWMRRGWTYQEALLSKRRLIFTEKHVYFECGGMACVETVTEPEDLMNAQVGATMKREKADGKITLLDTRHRLFSTEYLYQVNDEPWLIQHRIAEYTERSLTFEEDTLDAFLGVLRYFKNPKCPISHVWGVPVLWSSAKWSNMEGFATGLCWIGFFPTTQVIKRRIGFPSWSWAGWQMPVSPRSYFYRYGFKVPYEINFSFETKDGKILPWSTYETAYLAHEVPELSQYLHVEGWSLKCRLHASDHIPEHTNVSLRSYWSLTTEGSNTQIDHVVFHKQYSNEEWTARKNRVWDILVIGNPDDPARGKTQFFDQHPPFGPFFMILEDIGECYERVGYLDLAHGICDESAGEQDLSIYMIGKKRRSFKLG